MRISSVGDLSVISHATAILFSASHSVGWSLVSFTLCFLCSLIFMVLWYSMFTVVFVVFILHCCSVYHIFITSPFILRKVTRRLLSYFSFLKKLFLRILEDLVSRKWSI